MHRRALIKPKRRNMVTFSTQPPRIYNTPKAELLTASFGDAHLLVQHITDDRATHHR